MDQESLFFTWFFVPDVQNHIFICSFGIRNWRVFFGYLENMGIWRILVWGWLIHETHIWTWPEMTWDDTTMIPKWPQDEPQINPWWSEHDPRSLVNNLMIIGERGHDDQPSWATDGHWLATSQSLICPYRATICNYLPLFALSRSLLEAPHKKNT